ncbi:hypothetical protein [endosymbiont GvMRE of Glomus versiforme]|uniref:hypothetical protein n=1 Tax=endosymbiont GvMRE of Glomus versiforme TaxID=2039283 RepID=UPI000EE68E1F|nr:hypothetical protein [endosymbiont GvMRE of Glomus versiforme]RHZ36227.1 hypothetical protein GvMRE_Ic2g150 [endosymbiont GvMRE of Glomus versiforme]
MAVPLYHPNQVVWFRTNYNDGTDNLTKHRPYLLKEVNEKDKSLIFFPITSNRTHYNTFITQFEILKRSLFV